MPITSGLLTRPSATMPAFTKNNDLTATLAAYWAFVMIPNNLGIKMGANYTVLGGTAAPITASNLIPVLVDACKQGLGYYVADTEVKMPMEETAKETITLAAYADGLSTGITKFKYDFVLRHANNRDFLDFLKTNPAMDFWLITNTGYTYVDFSKTPLNFSGIGSEMNSIETVNSGMAKFSIQGKQTKASDGGIGVIPANTDGSKTFPEFTLTQGALVNATSGGSNGELAVIKRTSSIAVVDIPLSATPYTVSFRIIDINASVAAGRTVDYAGTQIAYNDSLQKLVVAASGTGILDIKVLANNETGVTGQKSYRIIL